MDIGNHLISLRDIIIDDVNVIGEAPSDQTNEGEEPSHNKLEDMIKELSTALTGVKHEQEYMQVSILNFGCIDTWS